MPVKKGCPIAGTQIDQSQKEILAALSITTVEELEGLLRTAGIDKGPIQQKMQVPDIESVMTRAGPAQFPMSEVEVSDVLRIRYSLGAAAPSKVLIEEVADLYLPPFPVTPTPTADLRGNFGPIRDQGLRGTCVAHAVVAMRECLHRLAGLGEVDLSEQFLYWNCKLNDGVPMESGTWLRVAASLIVSDGVCKENTWRYVADPHPEYESLGPPPRKDRAIAEAAQFKMPQALCWDPRSVDAIIESLQKPSPVAVSVPVFNNWFLNPQVRRDGNIPMPLPGAKPVGGHAVCVVGCGIDDMFAGGGYFIIRNSWGTRWAFDSEFGPGYGTIPYNYIIYYGWEAWTLR